MQNEAAGGWGERLGITGRWLSTQVDLGFVFYLVVLLLVLTYIRYILRWSLSDFLFRSIREFGELLRLRPTRGAVNAFLLVVIAALLFIYFFTTPLRSLLVLYHLIAPGSAQAGAPYEGVAFAGVFGIVGILSLMLI